MAKSESGLPNREGRRVSIQAYVWETTVRFLVFTLALASYQRLVMGWIREAVADLTVARWVGTLTGLGAMSVGRVCFLPRSYELGKIARRLFRFADGIFLVVCLFMWWNLSR